MLKLKRIRLLLEFYKGAFLISLGLIILLLLFTNITFAFFFGSCIGLFITLFLKETNKNKDYLFYMNCNLSKLQLYGFSLLLNLFITLLLLIIF